MRRILLTELRRGVAPLAAVAVAVVTTAVLFNEVERWAGRWADLNGYIRVVLVVVGPIAVALAAWSGGRDRRRRMDDLLASTPRPATYRTVVGWASVTIGLAAGVLVAWVFPAVLVGRIATYGGGRSWVALAVAFIGVGACAAVGFAVGRTVTGRVLGPGVGAFAGLAAYVLFGFAYEFGASQWLVPYTDQLLGGRHLVGWAAVAQPVFFVAVGAVAIACAARRWAVWTTIAGVAAVVAAIPFVRGADADDMVAHDPGVFDLECVGDVVEVCAQRPLAFALDQLEPFAREALNTWEGLSGAPTRVVATRFDRGDPIPDGSVGVSIEPFLEWDGAVSRRDEFADGYGLDLVNSIRSLPVPEVTDQCGPPDHDGSWRQLLSGDDASALYGTASRIVGAAPYGYAYLVPDGEPADLSRFEDTMWDRVSAYSRSEQDAWFSEYAEAVAGCRFDALTTLARETLS